MDKKIDPGMANVCKLEKHTYKLKEKWVLKLWYLNLHLQYVSDEDSSKNF